MLESGLILKVSSKTRHARPLHFLQSLRARRESEQALDLLSGGAVCDSTGGRCRHRQLDCGDGQGAHAWPHNAVDPLGRGLPVEPNTLLINSNLIPRTGRIRGEIVFDAGKLRIIRVW